MKCPNTATLVARFAGFPTNKGDQAATIRQPNFRKNFIKNKLKPEWEATFDRFQSGMAKWWRLAMKKNNRWMKWVLDESAKSDLDMPWSRKLRASGKITRADRPLKLKSA